MKKSMKLFPCFLAVIALTSALAASEDSQPQDTDHCCNSKVIKLTKEDYQPTKQTSESLIVLWHGSDRQSQKILTDWPKIIELLASKGLQSTVVATSNYEYLKQTAKTDGITKSPGVVLYFQHGLQKLNYNGYMTLPDISTWVQKTLSNPRTPSKPIYNITHLQDKVRTFQEFVFFVGYSQETPEFKAFYKMAEKRKEISCMHSFEKEIREQFHLPEENGQGFFLVSKKEEQQGLNFVTKYQGDLLDTEEIKTFLKVMDARGLKMLESNQVNQINQGKLPNLILALNDTQSEEVSQEMKDQNNELKSIFLELRFKYVNQVQLQILNLTEQSQQILVNDFELGNRQPPYLMLVEPTTQTPSKYFFRGDNITLNSTIQFYEDFKAGKLEKIISQEDPIDPEIQEKLLVKSATTSNWNQLVIESPVDVVVFFYGIESRECHQMKPQFYLLAHKLQNNKNLRFVRVNHVLNDIPDYPLGKVPQIIIFQANTQRSTISMIYQRTADSMIEALRDSVTFPWVEPIPNSEINTNDIYIDKTPRELEFEQDMKKQEKKYRQQQKKEEREMKKKQKEEEELKKQKEVDEKVKESLEAERIANTQEFEQNLEKIEVKKDL